MKSPRVIGKDGPSPLLEGGPRSIYQCVSKPGHCKFEWCCSPECACVLKVGSGTPQEAEDIRKARKMQSRWRSKIKNLKKLKRW